MKAQLSLFVIVVFIFLLLSSPCLSGPRPVGSVVISQGNCRSEVSRAYLDKPVRLPIHGADGECMVAEFIVSEELDSVEVTLSRVLHPKRGEEALPTLIEVFHSEMPLSFSQDVIFLKDRSEIYRYRISL